MLLSSLVIVMVSGIFLAQNRSYQVQLGVTDAHHNARAVTELLSKRASFGDGGRRAARRERRDHRTHADRGGGGVRDKRRSSRRAHRGWRGGHRNPSAGCGGLRRQGHRGGVGLLRRRLDDDRRRELERRHCRALLRQRGRHGGSPRRLPFPQEPRQLPSHRTGPRRGDPALQHDDVQVPDLGPRSDHRRALSPGQWRIAGRVRDRYGLNGAVFSTGRPRTPPTRNP